MTLELSYLAFLLESVLGSVYFSFVLVSRTHEHRIVHDHANFYAFVPQLKRFGNRCQTCVLTRNLDSNISQRGSVCTPVKVNFYNINALQLGSQREKVRCWMYYFPTLKRKCYLYLTKRTTKLQMSFHLELYLGLLALPLFVG